MKKFGTHSSLLKLPAILYGAGVGFRNFLYNYKLLSSYKPKIPTICVGNLSIGGTGKTPHIELIIELLKDKYKIAVLSRGYGRVTKEPIVASDIDNAETIGDEPYQIYHKYPEVLVYIDGNRRRAIKFMEAMPKISRPDIILMDDGFQHRRVKPTYSILLTPFHRPFYEDYLLPYGTLREHISNKQRAETIIVTHTPTNVKPIDLHLVRSNINPMGYQDTLFSRVSYMQPRRLFEIEMGNQIGQTNILRNESKVLLLSAIGNPNTFYTFCKKIFPHVVEEMTFRDHHRFTYQEVNIIVDKMMADKELYLLTTEKDAMRLLTHKGHIGTEVRERIWYLPISVSLSPDNIKRLKENLEQSIKYNSMSFLNYESKNSQ